MVSSCYKKKYFLYNSYIENNMNASLVLIIILFLVFLVFVLILLFCRKKKSGTLEEDYSSTCPSLLTSYEAVTWSFATTKSVYPNLQKVLVNGSGVSMVQGVLIDPCFESLSFFFSGDAGTNSVSITSTPSIVGMNIFSGNSLSLTNEGSYYKGTFNESSVYLFVASCVSAEQLPDPEDTFVANNTLQSNSISIGNSSAMLYRDRDCTVPRTVLEMIYFALPEPLPFWNVISDTLHVQAWGPVSIGLQKAVNGRFMSLLSGGTSVGEFTLAVEGEDNKSFSLFSGSSSIPLQVDIFTYNSHTGTQNSFSVSFTNGYYIVSLIEETQGYEPNYYLRRTEQSPVVINGVQVEDSLFLAIGPSILIETINNLPDPGPDVPNPTPVNFSIPDAADPNPQTSPEGAYPPYSVPGGESADPSNRRLPTSSIFPLGATQEQMRDILFSGAVVPSCFDWRIVGNGRIETNPRNQEKTGTCSFMSCASAIGDSYGIRFNVMAPYPSSFGIISMIFPRGEPYIGQGSSPTAIGTALSQRPTRKEACWPFGNMKRVYPLSPGYLGDTAYFGQPGIFCDDSEFSQTFGLSQGQIGGEVPGTVGPVLNHIPTLALIEKRGTYTDLQVQIFILMIKTKIIRYGPLVTNVVCGSELSDHWYILSSRTIPVEQKKNMVFQPPYISYDMIGTVVPGSLDPTDKYGFHAVVIVGWGVTTDGRDIPYWIIRNSWGNGGDTGYYRQRMAGGSNPNNYGYGFAELAYADTVKAGPLSYVVNVGLWKDTKIKDEAPTTRYESAGQQNFCTSECSGKSGCYVYDGCESNCCPLLAPLAPPDSPIPLPLTWVLEDKESQVSTKLTNAPGDFFLKYNDKDMVQFTRKVDGSFLPSNGVQIISSSIPNIPVGTTFSYDLTTNSYYSDKVGTVSGGSVGGSLTLRPFC